jgi:molybdopterin molybdotransferase
MTLDTTSPQRIARLTPLTDVLARVDALVKRVEPREVATAAAVGRVLAGDVTTAAAPRVALALRDGWAVSADLTTDASSYAPVPLPAAARIDVGQPMPSGADAVALLDAVTHRHGQVEIIAPVGPGEGVLPAGADADRGVPLVRSGRRLSRVQASVLAACGIARVRVGEPSVRIVRGRLAGDAIVDAVLELVAGEVVAAGGRVVRDRPASAGPAHLEDVLDDETADVIVTIGGTGCGRNDACVAALARLGRVEVHGIALAPGETAAFGFVGPRPVLMLPGRLDAALAVWLVLGGRMMARLTAAGEEEPVSKVRLARKVASALGLAEVVPVRIRAGAAEPIASGYVPWSALAQADGWILVPAESEGYPPGTEVVIRAWS